MSDCTFCYKPCLDGQDVIHDGHTHAECNEKRWQRYESGKCMKCGVENHMEYNHNCSGCDNKDAKYKGYGKQ